MPQSCLTVCFPPCVQLKSFHNELLTQLEQKVELDSRYLSVSTPCAVPAGPPLPSLALPLPVDLSHRPEGLFFHLGSHASGLEKNPLHLMFRVQLPASQPLLITDDLASPVKPT